MGDGQNQSHRIKTKQTNPIDRRIGSAVEDGPDVVERLTRLGCASNDIIEIRTELPARVDCDIIIATVARWCDIARIFGKPVRVYGWSYNEKVEDYIQGIVAQRDNVHLTALPSYLREVKKYA